MKSDILILLIGTSPMPNFISLASRLKKDGKAYFICSNKTNDIGDKLKKVLEGKLYRKKDGVATIETIKEVDNPSEVNSRIKEILRKISENEENIKEKIVELNFTGGTKVMSCIAYNQFIDYFKEKANKALLSYFDGEKSEIIIKDVNSNEIIPNVNDEKDTFNISIEDISRVHFRSKKVISEKFSDEYICPINDYIYESLFENLKNKNRFIEAKNILFKIKGKIEKFYNKGFMPESDFEEVLNLNVIDFKEFTSLDKILSKYEGENKEEQVKVMAKDLGGVWLEKGLFKYLNKLKQNGDIDDVVNSLRRNGEKNDDFEVDLVVLNKKKIYVISVTTSPYRNIIKNKLYEVKLRAEQIAGSESRIGLICFGDSKEELEQEIVNIWDENADQNFICTWNELKTLEEDLKSWLCGERKINE